MQKHEKSIIVTLVLGFVSILSLIFMVLALLDIYQGRESDLSSEWAVVASGLIIFILLSSSAIFTSYRLLKSLK